ncbi:conserved Plasmodium protein, unknown function [Plasmodium ovale]|uniref:Uncharacterized protein n=1 Tax=Plasmodium ovale TaxID=36330 RepID=A0A1C3KN87_PLAOA|nr:conserved Plasmodium protein, unknown function [Plasmodium ovale]
MKTHIDCRKNEQEKKKTEKRKNLFPHFSSVNNSNVNIKDIKTLYSIFSYSDKTASENDEGTVNVNRELDTLVGNTIQYSVEKEKDDWKFFKKEKLHSDKKTKLNKKNSSNLLYAYDTNLVVNTNDDGMYRNGRKGTIMEMEANFHFHNDNYLHHTGDDNTIGDYKTCNSDKQRNLSPGGMNYHCKGENIQDGEEKFKQILHINNFNDYKEFIYTNRRSTKGKDINNSFPSLANGEKENSESYKLHKKAVNAKCAVNNFIIFSEEEMVNKEQTPTSEDVHTQFDILNMQLSDNDRGKEENLHTPVDANMQKTLSHSVCYNVRDEKDLLKENDPFFNLMFNSSKKREIEKDKQKGELFGKEIDKNYAHEKENGMWKNQVEMFKNEKDTLFDFHTYDNAEQINGASLHTDIFWKDFANAEGEDVDRELGHLCPKENENSCVEKYQESTITNGKDEKEKKESCSYASDEILRGDTRTSTGEEVKRSRHLHLPTDEDIWSGCFFSDEIPNDDLRADQSKVPSDSSKSEKHPKENIPIGDAKNEEMYVTKCGNRTSDVIFNFMSNDNLSVGHTTANSASGKALIGDCNLEHCSIRRCKNNREELIYDNSLFEKSHFNNGEDYFMESIFPTGVVGNTERCDNANMEKVSRENISPFDEKLPTNGKNLKNQADGFFFSDIREVCTGSIYIEDVYKREIEKQENTLIDLNDNFSPSEGVLLQEDTSLCRTGTYQQLLFECDKDNEGMRKKPGESLQVDVRDEVLKGTRQKGAHPFEEIIVSSSEERYSVFPDCKKGQLSVDPLAPATPVASVEAIPMNVKGGYYTVAEERPNVGDICDACFPKRGSDPEMSTNSEGNSFLEIIEEIENISKDIIGSNLNDDSYYENEKEIPNKDITIGMEQRWGIGMYNDIMIGSPSHMSGNADEKKGIEEDSQKRFIIHGENVNYMDSYFDPLNESTGGMISTPFPVEEEKSRDPDEAGEEDKVGKVDQVEEEDKVGKVDQVEEEDKVGKIDQVLDHGLGAKEPPPLNETPRCVQPTCVTRLRGTSRKKAHLECRRGDIDLDLLRSKQIEERKGKKNINMENQRSILSESNLKCYEDIYNVLRKKNYFEIFSILRQNKNMSGVSMDISPLHFYIKTVKRLKNDGVTGVCGTDGVGETNEIHDYSDYIHKHIKYILHMYITDFFFFNIYIYNINKWISKKNNIINNISNKYNFVNDFYKKYEQLIKKNIFNKNISYNFYFLIFTNMIINLWYKLSYYMKNKNFIKLMNRLIKLINKKKIIYLLNEIYKYLYDIYIYLYFLYNNINISYTINEKKKKKIIKMIKKSKSFNLVRKYILKINNSCFYLILFFLPLSVPPFRSKTTIFDHLLHYFFKNVNKVIFKYVKEAPNGGEANGGGANGGETYGGEENQRGCPRWWSRPRVHSAEDDVRDKKVKDVIDNVVKRCKKNICLLKVKNMEQLFLPCFETNASEKKRMNNLRNVVRDIRINEEIELIEKQLEVYIKKNVYFYDTFFNIIIPIVNRITDIFENLETLFTLYINYKIRKNKKLFYFYNPWIYSYDSFLSFTHLEIMKLSDDSQTVLDGNQMEEENGKSKKVKVANAEKIVGMSLQGSNTTLPSYYPQNSTTYVQFITHFKKLDERFLEYDIFNDIKKSYDIQSVNQILSFLKCKNNLTIRQKKQINVNYTKLKNYYSHILKLSYDENYVKINTRALKCLFCNLYFN